MKNNATGCRRFLGGLLGGVFLICATASGAGATSAVIGCANGTTFDYGGTFAESEFEMNNALVDDDGKISLPASKDRIDLSHITIPARQRVWATYIYEGAGFRSDFGWALDSRLKPFATNEDGSIDWKALIDADKALTDAGKDPILHPIFVHINDDATPGGVFDADSDDKKSYGIDGHKLTSSDLSSEENLEKYDDGTGLPFVTDGKDGVDPKDMRKCITDGCIEMDAGTEIVFFLIANGRWYDRDHTRGRYFSKKAYNSTNDKNNKYQFYWSYGPGPDDVKTRYNADKAAFVREDRNENARNVKSYLKYPKGITKDGKIYNKATFAIYDLLWRDSSCFKSGATENDRKDAAKKVVEGFFKDRWKNKSDLLGCHFPSSGKTAREVLTEKLVNKALAGGLAKYDTSGGGRFKDEATRMTCTETAIREAAGKTSGNWFVQVESTEPDSDGYYTSRAVAEAALCWTWDDCAKNPDFPVYDRERHAPYPYPDRKGRDDEKDYWVNPVNGADGLEDLDVTFSPVTKAKSKTEYKYKPSYMKVTPKDSETHLKAFKRFNLGEQGGGKWVIDGGWLGGTAVQRLAEHYGIVMSDKDEVDIPLQHNATIERLIIGAPKDRQDEWILGWEDLGGWGDTDLEDMVFRIQLDLKGMATLTEENAITPTQKGAMFTYITMNVIDDIPCSEANIDYWVALDGGATEDSWVKIDWYQVFETDKDGNILDQSNNLKDTWVPGNPRYTYRSGYVDFGALGQVGDKLVWRTELSSDVEDCIASEPGNQVPRVIDVELEADAAMNAIFSRSSPVVLANMVYSAAYETPAASWKDITLRGHLVATRTYDPADPGKTDEAVQWNAGKVLKKASSRKIKFAKPGSQTTVTDKKIGKVGFSNPVTGLSVGLGAGKMILPGTLTIKIGDEIFQDDTSHQLDGNKGGEGYFDRYTGEIFYLRYVDSHSYNASVLASYVEASQSASMEDFATANVSKEILNLTDEQRQGADGKYFVDDITGDNAVDNADVSELVSYIKGNKRGTSTSRDWILGAIDHSTPAALTAPGKPYWYWTMGETAVRDQYDAFLEDNKYRKTVVFAGAADGMLHAFNGGTFTWYNPANADDPKAEDFDADNPKTEFTEYRGYFKWSGETSGTADYGDGSELWAFIPGNLMPRLKNNYRNTASSPIARVDASPSVAEVYINGAWKSVVICAEGGGGDTVFALDVTTPTDPKLLWEYGHPFLINSESSPAIGMVNNKWYAFFVSGATDHNTNSGCTGDCASDINCYPSIFMIDIASGMLHKQIFLDSESAGCGGVPSGQPALVDYTNSEGVGQDGNADFLYVGTSAGYMYKVDLPDGNDCVINSDVSNPQPIYAAPTVVVNIASQTEAEEAGKSVAELSSVTVFWGTGDSPRFVDGDDSTRYNFYAYKDTVSSGCGSATQIWNFEMDAGERVFASAYAAAGKIYFGTTTSDTEDPCDMAGDPSDPDSGGNIYILDQEKGWVESGEDQGFKFSTGGIRSAPVVQDEHLFYKTAAGAPTEFGGDLNVIGGDKWNNEVRATEYQTLGDPTIVEMWWREVF